jgi:hypothetical protein
MSNITHKKVLITVNTSSIASLLDREAKRAVLPDIVKKIGSEAIPNTKDIIRGLPPILEEALMPSILGISKTTPDYDLRVKDYWAEYTVKVNPVKGETLDASTRREKKVIDGKEVDIDMPVNLDDYMKYYFAMQSSMVAKTEYDRANVGMFDFSLVDLEEAKKAEAEKQDLEDKAMKAYLTLDYGSDTARQLLEMFPIHVKWDEIAGPSGVKVALRNVATSYPDKFIAAVNDTNLEARAFFRKATRLGVIRQEGNAYFTGDSEVPLALSSKELIAAYKDPTKSKDIAMLKAKMEAL